MSSSNEEKSDSDEEKVVFDKNIPPLTDDEMKVAEKELIKDLYPKVDRYFIDPKLKDQKFCLHSFMPAEGATPNERGMYGMIKCRGAFKTIDRAGRKSRSIIRNIDSLHTVHISKVGHPFPMVDDDAKYAEEVDEVHLQQHVTEYMKTMRKEQLEMQQVEKETMKKRSANLQKSVEEEASDPFEQYIKLQQKRAQLIATYYDYVTRIEKVKCVLRKTLIEVKEKKLTNPEFHKNFRQAFDEERAEVGLKPTNGSFIQYMMDDADLSFLELPELYAPDDTPIMLETVVEEAKIAEKNQ